VGGNGVAVSVAVRSDEALVENAAWRTDSSISLAGGGEMAACGGGGRGYGGIALSEVAD